MSELIITTSDIAVVMTEYPLQTSYFAAAPSGEAEQLVVAGCEAAGVWVVARHGTRLPSAATTAAMSRLLPGLRDRIVTAWLAGRGELGWQHVARLAQWRWSVGARQASQLAGAGRLEHKTLGTRLAARLPSLTSKPKVSS